MSDFKIDAVFRAVDRFTRPLAKMGTSTQRFARRATRSLRSVDAQMKKVAAGMRATGAAIATLAVPAGLASAAIVKTGADFEQAITNVGAVGLKTRAEIEPLEKKALELGATTKFTATQAAEGMEIMARAGFKTGEIMSGIDGILAAAAASGLELAEVSDHVSNVLKGMGLEASEATRVADVLALASSRTNSSIATLGESMSNVASTARQMNIPLEDVVAGVAALQDVGLDASVAGSAMNTMLTQLAAPTDALAKKLKGMGVEFKDAQGNMLPFTDVIANISKGAKAAGGNMDQVALLAELVGLRGQKAAANLKDLFETGKLAELTAELKGAAGSAKKMADLRMETLTGDWTLFGSAVDGVMVSLFALKGGAMRETLQGLTAWVTENGPRIVKSVESFFATIQRNLPAIKEWTERLWRVVQVIGFVVLALKATAVVMAIIAALNPFTLIVAAVTIAAALIAAFWPEIVAGAKAAWSAVSESVSAFTAWVSEQAYAIAGDFLETWDSVRAGFAAMVDRVAALATTAYAKFTGAWSGLKSFFTDLWGSVVGTFNRIVGPILETLGSALNMVGVDIGGASGSAAPAPEGGPQMISPSERVTRSISESRQTVDVNINDPGRNATVPKQGRARSGVLKVQHSGAF